jgi:dTDP-L-rhamnose 4-epimerase
VAAIFLSRLLNGQPPLIFEDGLQSRDFVDVRDVARAVATALEHQGPGVHVLNVGTGRRTTVRDIATTLASLLGMNIQPSLLKRFRSGDIRHCIADVSAARSVLGFKAEHTLATGLGPLIEWCRNERPPDAVEASLRALTDRGLVR